MNNKENMVKVERIEIREDFPVRDEAYAILRGENGYFAFAWGWKYPYANEIPSGNVPDGENGIVWYETEESARIAMNRAVDALETVRGK